MRKIAYALTLCFLSLLLSPAIAEVYRQLDEKGQTVYSDTPHHAAENPVELPHLNEIPLTPLQTPTYLEQKKSAEIQYQIAITSPTDNATFGHEITQITVVATTTPALAHPQHYLQYYRNNEPLGELTKNTQLMMENLPRGSYQLSVAVFEKTVTARGLYQTKRLAISPTITIIQQRHHLSD